MKTQILLPVILASLLVGCASGTYTYNVLKPKYPPIYTALGSSVIHRQPRDTGKVDSLQPTLSWFPDQTIGVKYDLVIYESVAAPTPGKRIYYREGLEAAEHKVEDPLAPSKLYMWSVRTRIGDKVSVWATWDWKEAAGLTALRSDWRAKKSWGQYWDFVTPPWPPSQAP